MLGGLRGLLFSPVHPLVAAVTAQLVAPTAVSALMLVALRRELGVRAVRRPVPSAPGDPAQSTDPTVTNSL